MRRLILAFFGLLLPSQGLQAQNGSEELDFFEARIRPLLKEHCYSCHSREAKKQRGGLFLDSRDAVLKGGESGPAVVPGDVERSLLVRAIRRTTELRMPPDTPLSPRARADLERWVAKGAVMPATMGEVRIPWGETLWALRSLSASPPPTGFFTETLRNPVDVFVAARLAQAGLTPAPEADRRTLLRRLWIDLIGLPPSAEEVDAFLHDPAPDAYERRVESLLVSPHYGERWGRHWLDVARYADTKDGVLMFDADRVRPYAYTYRDYVIRAFNEDAPFSRMIQEQLAADRLDPPVEPWRLAAMGFLTLGRQYDNNIHDIIDDQIDTVSRGLMGLTIACARCHDHKYDPIPMADYYSLYGVFAGSETPLEAPLITPPQTPEAMAFETRAAAARKDIIDTLDRQYALLSEIARTRVTDYLVHVATTQPDPLESAIYFLSLAPEDLRPPIIARWRRVLEQRVLPDDRIFGPWHDLMALAPADLARSDKVLPILNRWDQCGPDRVHPMVMAALRARPPLSRAEVARIYGDLLKSVYEASKKGLLDPLQQPLLELMVGLDSPARFPRSQTRHYMSRKEKDEFGGKLNALDRMAVQSPHAAPRAVSLVDAPEVADPHVFLRGNPTRPGPRVPRQFPGLVSRTTRHPFGPGSGRLDLAKAIIAPENPLTPRVLVNRLWMHHFGEPLVATPSDFGSRGSPPTHPELLDYLANALKEGPEPWAMKKIHRLLVLSHTYRQASLDRPTARAVDPENRLLWRMNRRRLDFEAMRDSLLVAAGRLDARMGGRPVDVSGDPHCRRRSVYALVDRQSLPSLFRAFDFAVPDQSVERRSQTTVPQQALFGLNGAFVLEQARAAAERTATLTHPRERLVALFRVILGRSPEEAEIQVGLPYVTRSGSWAALAQVLLLTNEMMFVD